MSEETLAGVPPIYTTERLLDDVDEAGVDESPRLADPRHRGGQVVRLGVDDGVRYYRIGAEPVESGRGRQIGPLKRSIVEISRTVLPNIYDSSVNTAHP